MGDIDAVIVLIAPRALLLVSATADRYSADADEVASAVAPAWSAAGAANALQDDRYDGGHALTSERFERIVAWTVDHATSA